VSSKKNFQIEFRPGARRQFEKLPKDVKKRIGESIETLAVNPRPRQAIKMDGVEDDTYRIRVGDYRVIYSVSEDMLLILIVKVGHRKEVYR